MCVIHWFYNSILTCSKLSSHTTSDSFLTVTLRFVSLPSFIINDSSIGQVLYWQSKEELNTWERHDCIVSLGASQTDFSPNPSPMNPDDRHLYSTQILKRWPKSEIYRIIVDPYLTLNRRIRANYWPAKIWTWLILNLNFISKKSENPSSKTSF